MQSKKIAQAVVVISMFGIGQVYAHQGYLTPLEFMTENNNMIIHAGYTEKLFVPEFPLKAKFYAIDPKNQKVELSSSGNFKSGTILEAALAEKGTYKIQAMSDYETNYAQQAGKWKAVYAQSEDKLPAADQRDWLTPDEVKANDQKLVSKNHSQFVSYISREDVSNQVLALNNKGLELKFAQHPNQLSQKDGIKFLVLFNGKPVSGVKFDLHEEGEEHEEEAAEQKDSEQKNHQDEGFVSDKNGEVNIALEHAGKYLLSTQYLQVKAGEKPAKDTYQYVLSFEVK